MHAVPVLVFFWCCELACEKRGRGGRCFAAQKTGCPTKKLLLKVLVKSMHRPMQFPQAN